MLKNVQANHTAELQCSS